MIVYLKEAIRTWKGINSPEAVFVAACKEGKKPETQQAKGAIADAYIIVNISTSLTIF